VIKEKEVPMVLAALIAFGLLVVAWLAAPAEEPRPIAEAATTAPMEGLPEAT
jgi:hypothetical protein